MFTHHFIFKGAFKFKPSVTGAPVVYHHNHITQGGQSVQAEILDSFEPIVHQLHLEEKHIFSEVTWQHTEHEMEPLRAPGSRVHLLLPSLSDISVKGSIFTFTRV